MKRINNFDMDYKECISVMSDGNPGAINVMCQMISHDPIRGQVGLCHLDDKEIYGSKIWVMFKDECGSDIKKFMDKVFTY